MTSEKEFLDLNIFTRREILVLNMLLKEIEPKEIAHEMKLTQSWVYYIINRIFFKTKCTTKSIYELRDKYR